ncbi:protein RecA [Pasteurella multocida]|nr:protein RecA [Pasteurella multocida]
MHGTLTMVKKIGQGKANAMKWLEEHPEEALALETKLRNELLANPEKSTRGRHCGKK